MCQCCSTSISTWTSPIWKVSHFRQLNSPVSLSLPHKFTRRTNNNRYLLKLMRTHKIFLLLPFMKWEGIIKSVLVWAWMINERCVRAASSSPSSRKWLWWTFYLLLRFYTCTKNTLDVQEFCFFFLINEKIFVIIIYRRINIWWS